MPNIHSEFTWFLTDRKNKHLKIEVTGQFDSAVLINFREQLDLVIKWLQEEEKCLSTAST